jgi:hypothetical protein
MRAIGLLLALIVGAALGAGAIWLRFLHYPVVVFEGPSRPMVCARYTADDREAFPRGVVATPVAAAKVFDQAENALGGGGAEFLLRRRVIVRDLGDDWLVRDESIHPMPGGGLTFRISKCDGRTTLIEIAQ